ncbi:type II toxin-antitoxin system tRNA(fMet)-specific endonuclease VapC [Lonepinella sp. BR2930]|uniref:type II toxin-antitoxin system tRNA(fMet)-specific endonuclease VapC n=1 Tax=Lonepinella sp. BR2930 TaxID=3434554 RepID=UPI003F6E223A
MKYLLDTNICIYIINHKPPQVFERFAQYELGDLAISSITVAELAFGVEKSGSLRNKEALNKFLIPLEIISFDENAIWHYAKLRNYLQQQGTIIGLLDMLIAAQALSLNVPLVTNNKEFCRIPNLLLDNWV